MRRWLLAMLAVLSLIALPAVPAGAEAAERAAVRMPFDGQWANAYATAPWEHGRHTSQDWAMDLFAVSAPVRINIADATGTVDLEVTDVVLDATCAGRAGSYVTVRVSVDGVVVGTVLYHHLVQVNVAEGDHVASGKVLGRTVAVPDALSGTCWHVSTPMGIHTHMAMANAVGHSCFERHEVGQALNQGAVIGVLGHRDSGASVGAGPRADCDSPELARCRGLVGTIYGTPGHDEIIGTAGPDVIIGLGGRDVIRGLGGDDIICAGAGADDVDGGGGDDYINAGLSGDVVQAGPGDDRVVGRQGADQLRGGGGTDRLIGGTGDDVLKGGGGDDAMIGKDGLDRCLGGSGADHTHPSCEIVAQRP
ncbi:MAG: hypothetical protein OEW42_12500 [Acidimicrobiia bacterium]|nr:hypothetical protein [Acidimicrobiia bacterium]MDH5238925.1 hypothetical protein [Acidimicrobiia bacterium]